MSQKLFDYECPEHGVFEAWGSAGEDARCPKCMAISKQMIGCNGFVLPMNDEGFPRAYRKWADDHERAARKPENPDVDELGY